MAGSLRMIRNDLGELLARHQRGQPLESFANYEDDPILFIANVLKGEPWLKQREIAELVRDHRKVVVRSCNAAGKDWLSGRLALWWVFGRQGRVIITGATEVQALEVTMKEVADAFDAAGDALPGEIRAKGMVIGKRTPILVKTATEAGKLTGFHDERLLFIITEGQSCDEHVYEAADACATGASNRVLVIGNPTEPHGRFRRACDSEAWQSVKISAFDIPNVIEGREVVPGLATAEWIRDIELDWGRQSSFFASRVLAEFPTEHEFSLIKRDWLRACAYEARRDSMEDLLSIVAGTAAWGPETTRAARDGRGFDSYTVHAFGFDVAATRDRCALAYVCDRDLIWCQAWQPEGDLFAETDKMLRLAELAVPLSKPSVSCSQFGRIVSPGGYPLGRAVIAIDAGGLGLGAYEHLRRRTKVRVEAFVASQAGDEATLNARAEGYVRLANAIAAGAIRIPRDEELWEELLDIRVVEGDRLRLEPKQEIRKRLGRSPDLADATMMAWTAAEPWIRKQERIA